MVSRLADSTEIKIQSDQWGITYRPGNILTGISITWGRQSLWDAPVKRSCKFTISYEDIQAARDQWFTFLRANVTVTLDGTVVFVGHIDSMEFEEIGDQWWIAYSAVEATGWNNLMSRTFETRANTPALMRASMEIQSGGIRPNIIEPATTEVRFRPPAQPVTLTYEQGWGAVAAPWPLSHPQWSPDYSQCSATTWRLDHAWGTNITVFANEVAGKPPRMDAGEMTRTIYWESGGTYGESNNGTPQVSSYWALGSEGGANSGRKSTNPYAVKSYPLEMINAASNLAKAQITAPREFTFYDDLLMEIPQRIGQVMPLFYTWEQRRRFKINPDGRGHDPYAAILFDAQPLYVAIGGTLTIRHDQTAHDVTAIYASDQNTGAISNRTTVAS